tara:strand:- start:332 stop:955 length:624 start_codon:yes stop_codon:yes gene_type:complete
METKNPDQLVKNTQKLLEINRNIDKLKSLINTNLLTPDLVSSLQGTHTEDLENIRSLTTRITELKNLDNLNQSDIQSIEAFLSIKESLDQLNGIDTLTGLISPISRKYQEITSDNTFNTLQHNPSVLKLQTQIHNTEGKSMLNKLYEINKMTRFLFFMFVYFFIFKIIDRILFFFDISKEIGYIYFVWFTMLFFLFVLLPMKRSRLQ